jgi:hypothetical protein
LKGFKEMPRGGKRIGAGRPVGTTKGDGMPTHVVRVSAEVTKEQCEAIPELIDLINHWEEECLANPESSRHYYLRKMLDEVRALGF